MKQSIFLLAIIVFGTFFLLSATMPGPSQFQITTESNRISTDTIVIKYEGKVKAIIDQKCYSCHSEKGENEDAKKDLLWDELPKLAAMDQVYTLDAIVESVEEGEMPPSKHVFWYPQKKLTKEEANLLIDWASDLSDKIYKSVN